MTGQSDHNDDTRTQFVLSKDAAVGHYRIIEKIGAGGMGEVYLAHDTKLERQVALKFLPVSMCADEECRSRFKREAQAAAKLSHPHIITIHEVNEHKGRPFFAMEHIKGQSLKEYVESEDLSVAKILQLTMQVSDGLQAAHQAGVIHRDIKPSNILIDEKGHAIIVDFGLATVKGCGQLTKTGQTAGTPLYMSPEQVRGESVGATSDLFSLGVVTYQMLTGKLPFTGEYEASIIYSILNDDPPPIKAVRQDVPEAAEALVSKLMAKDSGRRFQAASDVSDSLSEIIDEMGASQRIISGFSVKHSSLALTGILVLAVVAVLVMAHLWLDPFGEKTLTRETLAVLPFENLGTPEYEYFADGITGEITTHLQKFSDLRVISRTSSMLYKESQKSPQQIGAELGATFLLEGEILWDKSGGTSKVRINASLVRAKDGSSAWGDSYEREMDKIFDVQSDIARNVTRALNIAVHRANRDELTRVPTSNLVAYDYYLRGNDYFNHSDEIEDVSIAIQLYEMAIELDSNFAEAHAMLSRGYASTYWEYYDHSDERKEQAFRAARKALELQPNLVLGHLALGYCHYHCDRMYERALVEFDLALQREPNNADLYNAIAAVQRRQSDLESAVENFVTAAELDPRSHRRPFDVSLTYGMMRRYSAADTHLARTIALAPDWALPYIYRAWLHIIRDGDTQQARLILDLAEGKADLTRCKYYWWLTRLIETDCEKILSEIKPGADTAAYHLQLAQLYRLMGNNDLNGIYADSARLVFEERLIAKPDDPAFLSSMGVACAYLGMQDRAISCGTNAVNRLESLQDAFDVPFLILNLAEVFVVCEQYDAAVEQLRLVLSIPGFASPSYLKLDPLWEPLRDRTDFNDLLAEAA